MKNDLLEEIQKTLNGPNVNELEAMAQIKKLIIDYEYKNHSSSPTKSISEASNEAIERLKNNNSLSINFKTGFSNFDNEFGGLNLGEYVIVGARPGMGKTTFLVNLALNVSTVAPVLFISLDLSEHMITARFISANTGIEINKILSNNLNTEEIAKILTVEKDFKDQKVFVNDVKNNSIFSLSKLCEEQIRENGIKVIIIDYIQMIDSNKFKHNRDYEVGFISRELKNISKQFNVCVIASSQLNRSLESRGGDKRPQLSDLRSSGSIEQDADKVIFIYRAEYYGLTEDEFGNPTNNIVEIIMAKNRTGHLESIKLLRDQKFTRFLDFSDFKKDFNFNEDRLHETKFNDDNTPF